MRASEFPESHTMTHSTTHANGIHALRIKGVMNKTTLSRSQIYRLIAAGKFPKPVRLSEFISAWDEAAVDAWLLEKFKRGA